MPGSESSNPTRPGVKLTCDDLWRLPDDRLRHELIDGEHVVTPSPNIRHQQILGALYAIMWRHLEEHPLGLVLMAPSDVVFSTFDLVQPDLLYVSHARRSEVVTPQHVRGAPDLVVEVGSPSTRTRDETAKLRAYERFGVAEYWVVDPARDVVRVYRRTAAGFARPIEYSRAAGNIVTTPLLPGLEVPLERIFRD